MLVFDHVHHRYGDLVALEDLALEIPPGEIFGLLGPNGAGKTTTIKIATALLRPSRGRVLLDGSDVQQEPVTAKARYGLLPDEPFFYERLSARQFLAFIGHVRQIAREDLERRIERHLDFFSLSEAADAAILTYSLGMRKKLGLAAALLHDPNVLFLDEPTSGLDPRSARNTRDLLKGLRDRGITVLLTSHQLDLVEELCGRIAILHHGRVVALGTLDELRARGPGGLEELFLRLTGGDGAGEAGA